MSTTFTPSSYQQDVYQFVTQGSGNAVVNAVAGSGKTTTLIESAKQIKTGRAIFIAFNNHTTATLKERMTGTQMAAKTIYSIGMGCLYRAIESPILDENKYWQLSREWVYSKTPVGTQKTLLDETIRKVYDLANLARLTLTDASNQNDLNLLERHYDLDIPQQYLMAAADILSAGERIAKEEKRVDFTDMLWLPACWDLRPKQADWVFVDECQDLSRASLELALKCKAPGGRMLFVGDPNQSIYGFAGADADSFKRVKQHTRSIELPLSVCYRCPKSHIALAKAIVPNIEPSNDAPDGIVADIQQIQFLKLVKPGDTVLCRKTAPLVSLCIQLIRKGISAQVRGRDLGKDLSGLVRRIARQVDFEFEEFLDFVDDYEKSQIRRLGKREGGMGQIQSLMDRCNAIRACYDAFEVKSLVQLCDKIEELFSDNQPSLWLSTVHRAKGLEASRIFLLAPDDLPLTWPGQQQWEIQQEVNLKYVALTRGKEALYLVR